jgi:hypothetical protein
MPNRAALTGILVVLQSGIPLRGHRAAPAVRVGSTVLLTVDGRCCPKKGAVAAG